MRIAILAALVACQRPVEREIEVEHRVHRGPQRPSSIASRLAIAEAAAREPEVGGAPWRALGPFRGDTIDHTGVLSTAESGLVEAIRLDPRDPHTVFIATAGGGIWRTHDLAQPMPDWTTITDRLGNLAIGGFDIDPEAPDTFVVGLGEPFYQPGGFVQVTRDAGATWSAPVALGTATNVRDVRIDPHDRMRVLVATDAGLFRSTDGGASFALIDLPNGGVTLAEAAWSIAYTGDAWVVSAVAACDVGLAPPEESYGLPPGTACKRGNPGDIWRSTDGGATWTKSTIPALSNGARQGRMTLAAAGAHVYALVGNRDEAHPKTIDILRSDDGGATFVSAQGTLTNPDTVCVDLDVGSVQSGFNQAIAVDAQHPERVVVAGLFCSLRSLDATSATPTWQVVSDVYGTQTSTSCGAIPYVHSDFHAALIDPGGRVLLGGDGGIEASDDALTVASGSECSTHWIDANDGLATQLCYSIASDGDVIYTGLQDLSSRWRDGDRWNTINLSDGTGGAVAKAGDATLYWAAQVGNTMDRAYCRASCGLMSSWTYSDPTLPAGDAEAFVTILAALPDGGVLSHSQSHVWKADMTPAWTDAGNLAPYYIDSVAAGPPGVYGAAMFDHTAVSSDAGATWTISSQLGVGAALLGYAAAVVAFPPGSTGDTYVVGASAELLADGTPVPASVGHLLITHDRGQSWAALGNLPNVPVWAVKYAGTAMYAGTELGVYTSADGGVSWARLGSGLPMVRTTDLAIDGTTARAATWGRGIWELARDDTGKGDGQPPAGPGGCGCQSGKPDASFLLVLLALGSRAKRARSR